jgi:hypothetical protein
MKPASIEEIEAVRKVAVLPPEKVIVYYDGPRVYTVHSKTGEYYLANNVDEDDDNDIWVFVQLSEKKAKDVFDGNVSLRQCLLDGESPVYVIRYFMDRHLPEVEKMDGSKLPKEWLPSGNSFLDDYENDY